MASSIDEVSSLVLANAKNMIAGLETSDLKLLLASVGEEANDELLSLELMARCCNLLQQRKLPCSKVVEQYHSRMTRHANQTANMSTPNHNQTHYMWDQDPRLNPTGPSPPGSDNIWFHHHPPPLHYPPPDIWFQHQRPPWGPPRGLSPLDPRQRPIDVWSPGLHNQHNIWSQIQGPTATRWGPPLVRPNNNQRSNWHNNQNQRLPARPQNQGSTNSGPGQQNSAIGTQSQNQAASSNNRNTAALNNGVSARANASSNNRNTAALNNGVSTRANASSNNRNTSALNNGVSTRVNASSNNRNTSALNNGVSTRANASSNNRNTPALNNGVSTRTNASTSSATSRTPASTSNAAATARPTSFSNANAPNVNVITPARRPPSSSNANSPTINAITQARRPTTALNLNAGIAVTSARTPTTSVSNVVPPVAVPSAQRQSQIPFATIPQSVTSTVSSQSLVNVQMRPLAFYDVIEVLLAPSRLSFNQSTAAAALSAIHRALFQFPRPKQIAQVDAIIRLCAFDVASMEREQDDNFPPRLTVEVNYERISLPYTYTNNPGQPMQVENGPATPIAISNMKSLDRVSNVMKLAWHHDNNSKIKNYAVSINLMKRRTGKELVQRLRSLGVRDKQWTLAMIRKMSTATDKDVCAQTPIKASLACPVGKIKMNLPCRALPCKHLQCFDAETFICMQEKKPFRVFKCPVCNQHINFDDFRIDGYFVELLGKLSPGANLNIEIEPDGTWAPAKTEKERTRSATTTSFGSNNIHDTINLDDDDDEEEVEKNIQSNMISSSSCINVYSPPATSTCDEEPEVIDLDSSSSIEGDDESCPEAVESDHNSPPCSPPFSSAEETAQEESESCSVSSEPPTPSSSQKRKPTLRKSTRAKKYQRIVTFDDSSDSDSQ